MNDVKIREDKRLIFSYDKNAVLKTWDIDIGYCLQTLSLRFPSFDVLGKEIEFGRPALYTQTSSIDLILGESQLFPKIVPLLSSKGKNVLFVLLFKPLAVNILPALI